MYSCISKIRNVPFSLIITHASKILTMTIHKNNGDENKQKRNSNAAHKKKMNFSQLMSYVKMLKMVLLYLYKFT